MPAYNAEKHIGEALESILNQSLTDFECLVVDDGSTDSTPSIVRSYRDRRITLIENKHDFIRSLNLGLDAARGAYIARMDADDVMHPHRLQIQYATLEAEPALTVCGSWMACIGEEKPAGSYAGSWSGLIKNPLLLFLKNCFLFHPTTLIRKAFLKEHRLQYEEGYPYAEDFKLWTEIAKQGGQFYIDNQRLLYYRMSESQLSSKRNQEQQQTSSRIIGELLDYLIDKNRNEFPELPVILAEFKKLEQKAAVEPADIPQFFYTLFVKNKNRLSVV